jgi:hypothetical protein
LDAHDNGSWDQRGQEIPSVVLMYQSLNCKFSKELEDFKVLHKYENEFSQQYIYMY